MTVLKNRGKYWTRRLCKTLMESKAYIDAVPIAADLVTFTAGLVTTSSPILPIARVLAESATRVSQTLQIGELVSRQLPGTTPFQGLNVDPVVGNIDEADRAIKAWKADRDVYRFVSCALEESLPALILSGGQGYMESPSRTLVESYSNWVR